MAATYDPTLSENKDWVRLLIGDRDVIRPFLSDDEIEAILVENNNNKYYAAAQAAEAIVAKSRGLVEKAVDDLRLRWSDNAKSAYWEYIKRLRNKGMTESGGKTPVFRVLGTRL